MELTLADGGYDYDLFAQLWTASGAGSYPPPPVQPGSDAFRTTVQLLRSGHVESNVQCGVARSGAPYATAFKFGSASRVEHN